MFEKTLPLSTLLVTALATTFAVTTPTLASAEPSVEKHANSVNLSPLGVLVGAYTLNYERLFGGHGLLVEGSFSSQSNDEANSAGLGFALGYRWHWNGTQNSWFLGANTGFSVGTGDAEIVNNGMTTKFEVDTGVFFVVANIGKRWAWDNGLNVTIRAGAGYGAYDVSTESKDPDAVKAVELVDDLLTTIPVAIDGELSIGLSF